MNTSCFDLAPFSRAGKARQIDASNRVTGDVLLAGHAHPMTPPRTMHPPRVGELHAWFEIPSYPERTEAQTSLMGCNVCRRDPHPGQVNRTHRECVSARTNRAIAHLFEIGRCHRLRDISRIKGRVFSAKELAGWARAKVLERFRVLMLIVQSHSLGRDLAFSAGLTVYPGLLNALSERSRSSCEVQAASDPASHETALIEKEAQFLLPSPA